MELLDLEVNNIGPFKGSQKLSFRTSGEKFIHVVIGSNGSGKTTLLNAICWALGLYDPSKDRYVERWVCRECELGSVKLKVQVEGKIYEILRTAFEPINSSEKSRNSIKINLLNSLSAESIEDTEAFQSKLLSNISKTDFYRLLVFNQFYSSEGPGHVFRFPDFVVWAKDRLAALEIPGTTVGRRQRIMAAAIEYIGGPFVGEADGEKMIGAMLLHCLIREWIRANQSSIVLNSLNAETVPLLLDCSFSRLDSEHQIVAASLIAKFNVTVIIFDHGSFRESVIKVIGEVIGSVSAIRVGWNLWGGAKASLFGRSLELTRDDGTEFSELISHGD